MLAKVEWVKYILGQVLLHGLLALNLRYNHPTISYFLSLLQTVHASYQGPRSSDDSTVRFKCFWEGCKVFGKGSSSKSWLEKHVTNHGGNKPFQCIVDGCHQRFSTQVLS